MIVSRMFLSVTNWLECFVFLKQTNTAMFKKLPFLFNESEKTEVPTSFVCSCCGESISDWPAIGYSEPSHYSGLSDDDKSNIAELTSDTCIIRYDDQTDYFVRAVLFQKIIGTEEVLDYGIWVSLSEKNFEDYVVNFDNSEREEGYFGWICNNLLGYETTTSIPSDVYVQKNGSRPVIVPHESHEHPFVYDYYNGITMEEAHSRIKVTLGK